MPLGCLRAHPAPPHLLAESGQHPAAAHADRGPRLVPAPRCGRRKAGNKAIALYLHFTFQLLTSLPSPRFIEKGAAPLIVWHGGEYPDSVDAETAVPLATALPDAEQVHVSTLPGVKTMASVVHRGDYGSIAQAYIAIQKWIEENGYRLDGPTRQVHLQYTEDADPATDVTDVQYPIAIV